MAKPRASYRCSSCQYAVTKWVGRCPECGEWGSVAEFSSRPLAGVGSGVGAMLASSPAMPISAVDASATLAKPTGVGELDRVLGGGVVAGSVILLAGEPGVGKSTLLLEVVHRWAQRSAQDTALYVTAEESAGQVRMRADRTGAVHDRVYLASESDLATVIGHVEQVRPTLLVVDSVQTICAADTEGVVGGVTQVRAVTATLTALAKSTGIAVLLIGHVTKEGAVAGPRTLEHLVDVVLQFEGDRHSTLRMVRGIKNRFGAADEVGCFELRDEGIAEVADPSDLFLHHRTDSVPGTAVTVTMDGKRALLGEVQALVTDSSAPTPRRAVSGLDSSRVAMVLAVLDSRCGIKVSNKEVYVATVGGMRVTEPAVDLATAVSVASAVTNRTLPAGVVVLGEVGLAGEIRRVSGIARRLGEAVRLGFTHALVPPSHGPLPAGMTATAVPTVAAALESLVTIR